MKDTNNLEIEYCHEGVIKTFMWHNKLKYWVCIKSPIKRDPIAYQRAPQKISRDLTHFALKENIVDANSQWDDIKSLRVRNYNFKEETGHETFTQIGVIAQEIETVSPGLVSSQPNKDEEGNDLDTVTKAVKYSVLYMKAVKALQEAMERIETLEAKVAALEAN